MRRLTTLAAAAVLVIKTDGAGLLADHCPGHRGRERPQNPQRRYLLAGLQGLESRQDILHAKGVNFCVVFRPRICDLDRRHDFVPGSDGVQVDYLELHRRPELNDQPVAQLVPVGRSPSECLRLVNIVLKLIFSSIYSESEFKIMISLCSKYFTVFPIYLGINYCDYYDDR